MSKEDQQNKPPVTVQGSLTRFLPDGEFGAIEDPLEYEQRMSALPPARREFAEEGTHFAHLWQYFSEHRMPVAPAHRGADQRTVQALSGRADRDDQAREPGADAVPQ